LEKRGIIDDVKAKVQVLAQNVENRAADALSQASSLFEGIKTKVSEVIASTTEGLKAKAQEVKDEIAEKVAAAQQMGKNIGPCVSGQSDEVEDVVRVAGRDCEPLTVRSLILMPGTPSGRPSQNSRQFFSQEPTNRRIYLRFAFFF
jgi:histidinol dehydrogenase